MSAKSNPTGISWDQVGTGLGIVASIGTILWLIQQSNATKAATVAASTPPTPAQQNANAQHALQVWRNKASAATGVLR